VLTGATAATAQETTRRLSVRFVDGASGTQVPVRAGVWDRYGFPVPPPDPAVYLYQDNAFDSYFYCDGAAEIDVPEGLVFVRAGRGFEYEAVSASLVVVSDTLVTLTLNRFIDMKTLGWYSADTHVHITHEPVLYEVTPGMLLTVASAEDLNFVNSMEGPEFFTGDVDNSSEPDRLIYFSKEQRNASFSHLALIGLKQWIVDLGCATPSLPCARTLDRVIYDQVHAGGDALVVVAHPVSTSNVFDWTPWPGRGMWRGAAIDLVAGCVDAIELMSYSNEATPPEVDVYTHALNAGFRVPPTAGTDAVLCRGSGKPPGGYRVYARPADGQPFDTGSWMAGLRRGDCFVSNYPLFVRFEVGGEPPGGVVRHRDASLKGRVTVECALPLDRVEIIGDPGVLFTVYPEPGSDGRRISAGFRISTPGVRWVAARAVGPEDSWHVVDAGGLFAQTGPVYLELSRHDAGRSDEPTGGYARVFPQQDAVDFFLDLLDDVDALFVSADMTEESRLAYEEARDEARGFFRLHLADPPRRFDLLYPVEISWFHPWPWVRTVTPDFRWRRSIDPDPADEVTYTLLLDTSPAFDDAVTVAGLTDTSFTWPDSLALADRTVYYWRVIAGDRAGNRTIASPTTWSFIVDLHPVGIPRAPLPGWEIVDARPNPFNPDVSISYSVPENGGFHTVEIFDARGRLVRTLFDGRRDTGVWTETWDGRDRRDSPAASGVYFARLKTAGGAVKIRKLVLVK
jgi:hypothetical protein